MEHFVKKTNKKTPTLLIPIDTADKLMKDSVEKNMHDKCCMVLFGISTPGSYPAKFLTLFPSFLAECAKRLAEQWYQWEEEEKECHIYSTSCLCAWMLYIMLS